MLPPKRIAGCFCRVALIYGLLVLPWPGVRAGYAAFFRAGGNLIFRSSIPGGSVRFRPAPRPKGPIDTHVQFADLRSGTTTAVMTSSQKPGYLSTALVLALVLATPLPWRRRLRALFWGLILISAFVACELLIIVLHVFSAARLSLFGPPPPWDKVLTVAHQVATSGVVTWFIFPVFVWGLVCFRKTDWAKWAQTDPQSPIQHGTHARSTKARRARSRPHEVRRGHRNAVTRAG
jgi:hypothetical protein